MYAAYDAPKRQVSSGKAAALRWGALVPKLAMSLE
jgi:hypothetical protein